MTIFVLREGEREGGKKEKKSDGCVIYASKVKTSSSLIAYEII
jgi:hypothetical protein